MNKYPSETIWTNDSSEKQFYNIRYYLLGKSQISHFILLILLN